MDVSFVRKETEKEQIINMIIMMCNVWIMTFIIS